MHYKRRLSAAGMTLVEVMIASSIGIGIFLFLNSAMIKLQKTQTRFERRGEVEEIKWILKRHLSDMRAYEENPEAEVPTRANQSNFYYFENRRAPLAPLTATEKEMQLVRKDFKCPGDMLGCRVAAFDYKGQHISLEGLKLPNPGLVLATIGFETPDDKITRSFLPELKVQLVDQNDDAEVRVVPKIFYVNQEGGAQFGTSGPSEAGTSSHATTLVDPVSRANCYFKFVQAYPELKELAKELCLKAKNSAPADCFIRMKKEFTVDDILAVITCSQAVNSMPIECFKTAKTAVSIGDDGHALLCSGATTLEPINCYKHLKDHSAINLPDMLELKVCARAFDIAPAECLLKLKAMDEVSLQNALYLCPHHK
ncbi:MAG: hypothetical protein A2X86_03625 [Bdellovibrionales bacterium GWA2_49_15]|nr:MAG: hypothetical protein A2X86_03625 [Bdellovibrionales bacterium GWA2_49_15]HAZ12306.1 hypothetical protein [Bdellovibrionales bacterium]